MSSKRASKVVDKSVPINKVPKWFEGAKMNYTENLLKHPDDEKIAFFYTSERKDVMGIGKMTFGELRSKVAKYASSLRVLGIGESSFLSHFCFYRCEY